MTFEYILITQANMMTYITYREGIYILHFVPQKPGDFLCQRPGFGLQD